MDDHGFGGTVGRKGGKKAKRGSSKKQIGDAPKESPTAHDQPREPEAELPDKLDFAENGLQDDTELARQTSPPPETLDLPSRIDDAGPEVTGNIGDTSNESDKDKIVKLEEELAHVKAENAQLDDKYKGLLGRVASIRTTLTDRLNKDAEEYQQLKAAAEVLEERNKTLASEKQALEASLAQTLSEKKILSQEIQDLRHRFSVSQQNWSKEREEVDIIQNKLMEDLESTRKSAQDWEVLAMEESSVRRALEERCNDIEEQHLTQKDALEHEVLLRSQQVAKVSDLEKALHDIQKTRKEELRNLVETTQSQIESLVLEKTTLQEQLIDAEAHVKRLSGDVQRLSNLEAEVKEKTLLIGKLRHQGVILNEHLTKALRMIKRGDAQDNVDRQLVTNLFISFLGLPRGDTKRFEVLQLIASYLKWSDEDRETAGLSRPGTSNFVGSIPSRTMQSPVNQSLLGDPRDVNNSGENLAELWASFLQQQTENRGDGA